MNTALWIIQILLGIVFIMVGLMKTVAPVNKLNQFSWTTRSSEAFIRFVGISELLIGFGLILPQVTGIFPILSVIAAFSLCLIMILAMVEHIKYKETNELWKNILFITLSLFVAGGRLMY
jgi:hypothetical protein